MVGWVGASYTLVTHKSLPRFLPIILVDCVQGLFPAESSWSHNTVAPELHDACFSGWQYIGLPLQHACTLSFSYVRYVWAYVLHYTMLSYLTNRPTDRQPASNCMHAAVTPLTVSMTQWTRLSSGRLCNFGGLFVRMRGASAIWKAAQRRPHLCHRLPPTALDNSSSIIIVSRDATW